MRKIIQTEVMTFDELPDDKAKEKARDWWRAGDIESGIAWEVTQEDAKQIGLNLTEYETDSASFVRNMRGEFTLTPYECAAKILSDHGADCDTYKTASAFKAEYDKLNNMTGIDEEAMQECEENFKDLLIADYSRMLQKEIEYRDSAEYIDESILANEYTFTAQGKRLG